MFFLLRVAFWIGLVCVLLPSGGTNTASPGAQLDASQAVTLAGAAVSDLSGFCDRQPDACKVGGKVAVALGHKAEAGARTLYELVTTKIAETAAKKSVHPRPAPESTGTVRVLAKDRGTLTQADLVPSWHAPVPLPPRRAALPAT
jgi:hypothetical protein